MKRFYKCSLRYTKRGTQNVITMAELTKQVQQRAVIKRPTTNIAKLFQEAERSLTQAEVKLTMLDQLCRQFNSYQDDIEAKRLKTDNNPEAAATIAKQIIVTSQNAKAHKEKSAFIDEQIKQRHAENARLKQLRDTGTPSPSPLQKNYKSCYYLA